jgi:ABC-type uncharacterized transport system substrate-binding protein
MKPRRALASLLFALCAAPALWAHPHVFIDSSLEFEMSGRDCVGIQVSWTFDVVFSADIIGQFDRDRDGSFDQAETATIQAKAFSNLRKYGYFTFVRKGSVRTCPDSVEGFRVSQSDGRVTYRFRVPLEGKGVSDDFSVATFDSTFYCATKYVDGAASIRWIGDEPAEGPSVAVAANEDYPVYYNPFGSATDSRVYTKWEKGLQTAYPEEIRVRF